MSRREKQRENMLEEIKHLARQQMREKGTAGLSLNAIAREMDVSAPALYRYYDSRDALVTTLIYEAFTGLAEALEAAAAENQDRGPGVRLRAVLLAYRTWALEHPTDFELIYGNPIPGYAAPEDLTTPAAQRGFAVILMILADAHAAGRLHYPAEMPAVPEGLSLRMPPGLDLPEMVVHIGVMGWAQIHGMISLELFHHSTTMLSDPGLFYRHEVDSMLRRFGMEPETGSGAQRKAEPAGSR